MYSVSVGGHAGDAGPAGGGIEWGKNMKVKAPDALIAAAEAAALAVERAAADRGAAYAAAQSFYGVEVEALVGDEWVRVRDLREAEVGRVEAVRLFDCDAERGEACRTVGQVRAERARWSA